MNEEERKELGEMVDDAMQDTCHDADDIENWVERKKLEWEGLAFKRGYETEKENIIIRLGLNK